MQALSLQLLAEEGYTMIYWESIFEKVYSVPGASRKEIERLVNSLMAQLNS
jgi:hypothetical protein